MSEATDHPHNRQGLGIDIGAASVKVCRIEDGAVLWSEARPHDGDLPGTWAARIWWSTRWIPWDAS